MYIPSIQTELKQSDSKVFRDKFEGGEIGLFVYIDDRLFSRRLRVACVVTTAGYNMQTFFDILPASSHSTVQSCGID